jgi:hypothetical protein
MCGGSIHKVFRVAVSNSSPFLDLMLARQGTLKVALWCEEVRMFRETPEESLGWRTYHRSATSSVRGP